MNSPASLNWQLTVECVGFVAEITVKKQIKRTVGFDEVNSSVKESMKTWIKDSMDDLLVEKDEAGNDRQRRQRRGRQQTIKKPGSKKSGSKKQQMHENITCDGCSCTPIMGPRYTKQLDEDSYDVCEVCFSTLDDSEKQELTKADCTTAVVQIVLEANPDAAQQPNDKGYLPLHLYCKRNQQDVTGEIAKLLIEAFLKH